MSTGRGSPSDYDWEDGAGRQGPEAPAPSTSTPAGADAPFALPAHDAASPPRAPSDLDDEAPFGAPTFTYEPPPAPPEEERRDGRLPAWAILAMVAVQGAAAVAIVALVLGAARTLLADDEPVPSAAPSSAPATRGPATQEEDRTREPGTVTDADGHEVDDGTGGYDDPATIGEHTVAWNVWTGGTLSVTPHAVDLDATLPAAGGEDLLQDGYRLVLVEYEVRYDGTGHLAPAEELWLTGESDRTYFPDVGEGIVPDPMKRIAPLGDGQSASFHSAFLVPETEVETFRLGVETFSGEILYFATG
jgi:hypothetical protein